MFPPRRRPLRNRAYTAQCLLFVTRHLSIRDAAHHVATKTVQARSVESFAKFRIIEAQTRFLSIGGIGHPDLGRGGAERSECPPVRPGCRALFISMRCGFFLGVMRHHLFAARHLSICDAARHVATKTPTSGSHHAIVPNRLIERILTPI